MLGTAKINVPTPGIAALAGSLNILTLADGSLFLRERGRYLLELVGLGNILAHEHEQPAFPTAIKAA